VAQGTACADAILEVEETPIRLKCEECQSEFAIEEANLVCPDCGSARVHLLSGRELLIKSVEAE
jgi:hydrogenase nickel incorporation protein HypA/HybF